MLPRSVASNPNLAGLRKASSPTLNGSENGSTQSLPTSANSTTSGKMTSVRQRAKDLEQLASSGRFSAIVPRTSPSPTSSFVKKNGIGPSSASSPLSLNRPATSLSDTSSPLTPASEGISASPTNYDQAFIKDEEVGETVETKSSTSAESVKEERLSTRVEDLAEEDEDATPRQSITYMEIPKNIARQDSSRQANYSLKPRIYTPDLSPGKDPTSPQAPPRLPELFFQDSPDISIDSEGPPGNSTEISHVLKLDSAAPNSNAETDLGNRSLDALGITQRQGFETPPPNEDLDANNHTFFWHSPQDSTDEADEGSADEAGPSIFPSLPRNTQSTLTSASALGFGGPSDWEHFYGGDYETTDLIDDTDLYISKDKGERAKEEGLERDSDSIGAERRMSADLRSREVLTLSIINENPADEEIFVLDQVSRETDSNNALQNSSAGSPAAVPIEERVETDIQVHQNSSKETVVPSTSESQRPLESSSSGEAPASATLEAMETGSRTTLLGDRILSRTPPPAEIKLPYNEVSSATSLLSGPSSPPADDPNASEITISMVLPPDFDASSLGLAQIGAPPMSPPIRLADSGKNVFPQGDELPNPYAGLSPISKASLNRFIRMLREEEKTRTDHDKYFVFVNFMQRESKLRATLYDMDDESEMSMPPSARHSGLSSLNKRKGRSPARQKPLPVPPANPVPIDPTIGAAQSMIASGVSRQVEDDPQSSKSSSSPSLHTPVASGEDSSSGEAGDDVPTDSAVKSPSGANGVAEDHSVTQQNSLETLNRSIALVAPRSSIVSDPSICSASAPSLGKPSAEGHSIAKSPLPGAQILEHSLSVKSNENKPYDGDKATNRQSIYRPFSGMLRSSSSHRRKSTESMATVKSIAGGPDRKMAEATASVPHSTDKTPATPSKANRSGNRQTTVVEPLHMVVPHSNVVREEHRQLSDLRFDMNSIVDDFSFIHKTVLNWDSKAKVKRERYERERQQRITENDRRVEELFNDKEIGYGDISLLEKEHHQSESAKKAEEDREEVDSFVSDVFDVVWARINYEMDRLTPLYQEATRLVIEASAGRQMFEDSDERVPIAPIMDVLLILYQKLMIRHQKAFEAVLERDRRLKKTETSPWYAMGQFDKVKRIEKRFEDAEKKAILEFCKLRDDRANSLMDVLDQHTLRGVGANQDYMESVMQTIRRTSVQVAVKGDSVKSEGSKPSTDDVLKAKIVTLALARSSEQIVRTFHVADMLLNAADYEVSVASAKLSNADAASFKLLRDAKAKEDGKLAGDLQNRLSLIRSDTSRTQEEIAKLLLLMGENDPDLKFDLSKERDKRMIAALTEARKRQAAAKLLPPKS